MRQYIIKYNNGKIRQQYGINNTFHYLVGIGVIEFIINIFDGTIISRENKDDETTITTKISEYSASDLIKIKKE